MKHRAVLLAALALLAARPALADVRQVAREGSWTLHAGRTEFGREVCAMATQGPGGRLFLFQFAAGDRAGTVRLHSPSWNLPQGMRVRVVVGGADGTVLPLVGVSEGDGLRVPLGPGGSAVLESLLRSEGPVLVRAEEAEAATWTLSTNGVARLGPLMARCVEAIPSPARPDASPPARPSLRT